MARIILTIPGPWSNPQPDLWAKKPAQATLTLDEPDGRAAQDIVAVGRKADVLTDDDVARIRRHAGLLTYELAFERQGDRAAAAATARFCADALAAGAFAVFVDTSLRVVMPDTLKGAELDDAHTLFHLFVEFLVDDEAHEAVSEGMQCFDLPDVAVGYPAGDRERQGAAQAAVFSLCAQMVCDRLRPPVGGVFRASESAPWYRVSLDRPAAAPADGESGAAGEADPFENPRGVLRLIPR